MIMDSGCVAQLVERSLPIPEVRGSNQVFGKNLFILNICLLSIVYWKDENEEKEAGNGPFLKKRLMIRCCEAESRHQIDNWVTFLLLIVMLYEPTKNK